jgi:spore germination protein
MDPDGPKDPRAGWRSGPLADRARAFLERVARLVGLRDWLQGTLVAGGVLAVSVLLVVAMVRPHPPGGSARLSPSPARPEVIGFFENGWNRIFGDSFPSVSRHSHAITTVLAFWYSVDGAGDLVPFEPRPNVARWVREHRLRMGVLINNIPGAAHDNAGMLWTDAVRRRAVGAIAALARREGYQEVHVDFELLPPDARDGLTAFVRELKAAVPRGVLVSVSVIPPVGVPEQIAGAYDYRALASAADYLVLMAYDRHSSGGPPGPVSPLPWVKQNIQALLADGVPPEKLVLAAAVYGYDWIDGTNQAESLPLTEVDARIKRYHLTARWDAAAAEPFVRYTDARGRRHEIWYQDARTVRQRLTLVRRDRLKGIAIWRLGLETPRVWSVIDANLR